MLPLFTSCPVVVNIASIEEEVEWRAINEAIAATGLRIMGVSGCKIPRLKTEIDRAGIPLLTEGKKSLSSGTVRTHPAAASC